MKPRKGLPYKVRSARPLLRASSAGSASADRASQAAESMRVAVRRLDFHPSPRVPLRWNSRKVPAQHPPGHNRHPSYRLSLRRLPARCSSRSLGGPMPWNPRVHDGTGGAKPPDLLRELRARFARFRFGGGAGGPGKSKVALGVILVAVILGSFTSYYQVEPDEVGVVRRFGRYLGTTDPGPHFRIPFGIDQVQKVPVQRQLKMEFGFRTAIARRADATARRGALPRVAHAHRRPQRRGGRVDRPVQDQGPVHLPLQGPERGRDVARRSPRRPCGRSSAITP